MKNVFLQLKNRFPGSRGRGVCGLGGVVWGDVVWGYGPRGVCGPWAGGGVVPGGCTM